MSGTFFFQYALRSLRRDGQRSILALACIAFGVLALVAMLLLSGMIEEAFLVEPRVAEGGEVTLSREAPLSEDVLRDEMEALRAADLIGPYTLVAPATSVIVKPDGSGRVLFANRFLGVDPATYPLYGSIRLAEPAGATLAAVLAEPGTAVVTDDLAERLEIGIGDRFAAGGRPGVPPVHLVVGGIADDVPDRVGLSVFYSLETARQVARGVPVTLFAPAQWGPEGDTGARLEAAGWRVSRAPDEPDSTAARLFAFMLNGAGVLGLLIGGIGVANTMQVILARRMQEVATLKTVGYRPPHLYLIFGLETAMLGLAGGVVGVGLALLLSREFMRLLDESIPLMLTYHADPAVAAGGVLTGVLTAVIFGLAAIVRAGGVRPAVLLRAQAVRRTTRTRLATAGLYGLLLVLFTVLSSLVLGSFVEAAQVVAFGLAGLLVLGSLLGVVLLGVVRVPVPGMPLLGMARRSLRHRPVRAVYALVALTIGVFSIGFSAASLLNAEERALARAVDTDGFNLLVAGRMADEEVIREALARPDVGAAHAAYVAPVRVRTTADSLLPGLATVEGRDGAEGLWDVTIVEGAWRDAPGAAYAPVALRDRAAALAVGDTLRVTSATGLPAALVVAGFYEAKPGVLGVGPSTYGLLTARRTALALGGPAVALTFTVQATPARLAEAADDLGRALPETMVVTRADVGEFLNRTFNGLYLFVQAVAALALLAGGVLVANAVGLAMVERRRELGVLKAVGFTSTHVLRTVLLENALLGLLGGAAGLAAVHAAMAVVNVRFPQAHLSMEPWHALVLMAVSIAIAVGSAAFVAWRPTHVRPLTVLRSE